MNAFQRRHIGFAVVLMLASGTAVAASQGEGGAFHARLTGYQEVPAVATAAQGEFKGRIDPRTGWIDYELTYAGLENVRQAHIHLGQRSVLGGISVFLCQTAAFSDPTGAAPQCPASAGTVTGVIKPENVIGPTGQLLQPGALDEVIRAMRSRVTYVNVHTNAVPGGEIRGQIRARP